MQNWSTNSDDENISKMKKWLEKVAEIYQIQFPLLQIVNFAGQGCYRQSSNEIFMGYPSIVTLLHEFRHAVQFQNRTPANNTSNDAEDDARAWSLSLYYKVAPRSFKRLVGLNKILFVNKDDL